MNNKGDSAQCIPAHRRNEWNAWIDRVPHDFYHRAEYHLLAEQQGEGSAFLAVYGDPNRFVIWPYLLVRLTHMPGLEFTDLCDVTSVYGYPGPLALGCQADDAFLEQALEAIRRLWCAEKVVSAFSRTNPLLNNADLLKAFGVISPCGFTVSMDLTVPLGLSWAEYRRSHQYEIRKGLQAGLQVSHDRDWRRLDEFVCLYTETMKRVGAGDRYLFDKTYFSALRQALGDTVHLLVILREERVVAGAIFIECCGIVQYHLSATMKDYRQLAPTKVLLDGARIWAKARGNRTLHLGGGVAGAEDSLFLFKAGFSNRRHDFFIWRAVLDKGGYDCLTEARARFCARKGLTSEETNFFPPYRGPVVATGEPSQLGS